MRFWCIIFCIFGKVVVRFCEFTRQQSPTTHHPRITAHFSLLTFHCPYSEEEETDERKAQRAQRFKADLGTSPPKAVTPTPLRAPAARPRAAMVDTMDDHGDGGAGYVVGTCSDMCPAAERTRRMRQRDVAYFERPDQSEPDVTTRELAVKKFARKVTVRQRDEDVDDSDMWGPSDVRTMSALQRTMLHLRGLMDQSDVPFGVLHKFLWDRHRSVRQDLNVQHIKVNWCGNSFCCGCGIARIHVWRVDAILIAWRIVALPYACLAVCLPCRMVALMYACLDVCLP